MKKILFIIAPEGFRDEELLVPRKRFEEAGYHVVVAAEHRKQCFGSVKTKVFPDLTLAEVRPWDYAAAAVAGGPGAKTHLWGHARLLGLLRDFHSAGKPVGAICFSAVLPAQAGLLKGKRGTVWPAPEAIEEVRRNGVDYVAGEVVETDGIVSAPGPEHAAKFAETVLNLLKK